MNNGELYSGGNLAKNYNPIQGGVLLVTACNRNWDKLQSDGLLGSYADFIFTYSHAVYG